jgi:RNA polymerase sigma factor, sigma-70 family
MASWSETLASLFAAHRHRLETFVARRTRDPETAADLTQETFLRMARMRDGDKVEDPSRFLFAVAANLVRDHHRQTARRVPIADGESGEDQACDLPGAEQTLAAREDMAALRAAIGSLPPKTRAVFLLYRVEALSYREIGERLDISPRTVEYHLRQALAHCRAALRRAAGDGR